jgi:hypothetical protein
MDFTSCRPVSAIAVSIDSLAGAAQWTQAYWHEQEEPWHEQQMVSPDESISVQPEQLDGSQLCPPPPIAPADPIAPLLIVCMGTENVPVR